jgi:hypothetical protein
LLGTIPGDEAELIAFRNAEHVFSWKCTEPVAVGA